MLRFMLTGSSLSRDYPLRLGSHGGTRNDGVSATLDALIYTTATIVAVISGFAKQVVTALPARKRIIAGPTVRPVYAVAVRLVAVVATVRIRRGWRHHTVRRHCPRKSM
jgi:hypothetical protein